VQNATIFPKNVHFFATLLGEVAKALNVPVGDYTHFISSVCHDRSATQC
jgi:thymidylate synthase